jgi:hypothetical protein
VCRAIAPSIIIAGSAAAALFRRAVQITGRIDCERPARLRSVGTAGLRAKTVENVLGPRGIVLRQLEDDAAAVVHGAAAIALNPLTHEKDEPPSIVVP